MTSAINIIKQLQLKKHPEGGYYKEIYRSSLLLHKDLPNNFSEKRNCSTAIYYLLSSDTISKMHNIKSDEIWHYYSGTSDLELYYINNNKLIKKILSKNNPLEIVPAGCFMAAKLTNIFAKNYVLMGCTVSPGFDFNDFKFGKYTELIKICYNNDKLLKILCKD